MKAIMYHYVRDFDPAMPNFRFLNITNFRKQLDIFAREFGFVTRAEWAAYVRLGQMPADTGKVILTFDDAMSCHYTHVFPELMARGLWGIFYVPTGPYTGAGLLNVHRIHLLCGAHDGEDLWAHAQALVTEDMIPHAKRSEFRDATYAAQINRPGVSEFKRLLNYFIDERYRRDVIDQVARDFGTVFAPDSFYVPPAALAEMGNAGMMIGAHTVSHPVMSKLSVAEQAKEIAGSLGWIEQTVGSQDMRSYCHPYGGFHSFDAHTVMLLRENSVDFSFNVEPRDIDAKDIARQPHALPRHDCNLFAHGQAD
ncbi:polysaccharide deacetylase family protein [Roseibaca sp. V10]|uniref:Chitooligosaccharide deacetylase n=1 Tax=Roseinatronobacter domitianus TaxID=2940293 RepID=A0ABT0M2V3_9RHOB|nr:polysaccharide deacetylase family protein [Roseibaca domitiana]MCL1629169.1 polysaccharide deacetylase family protein [Roseibaca domitiana]